jgi:hypothetical protein
MVNAAAPATPPAARTWPDGPNTSTAPAIRATSEGCASAEGEEAGRPVIWTKQQLIDGIRWRSAPRNRAIATRYDKLAVRYEATVHIAAINEWLRPGFLDTP